MFYHAVHEANYSDPPKGLISPPVNVVILFMYNPANQALEDFNDLPEIPEPRARKQSPPRDSRS